ncbi:hypothetical protein Ciccas_002074 [Cichlidogyrus casuarinus]|uniref:ABC transporter domain-containing protein n=1 Tax=Cichlidogyrus casuarinus TaxID=1844966 RepID=A0ABD2QJB4_9PLAT
MPKKDQTIVGDRGASLSGGQKARIGLARVAYSQNDIVFLDDPLAAVDARVSRILFRDCIQEFMKNRMRILVTHQHHLLQSMDCIIVLKDGKMCHFGKYTDLVDAGLDLEKLCDECREEPETSAPKVNEESIVSDIDAMSVELRNSQLDSMLEEEPSSSVEDQEPSDIESVRIQSSNSRKYIPSKELLTSLESTKILLSKHDSMLSARKSSFESQDLGELDADKEGVVEGMQQGNVTFRTYWNYWNFGTPAWALILGMMLFLSMNLLHLLMQLWTAEWANYNDMLVDNRTTPVDIPPFVSQQTSLLIYFGYLLAVMVTGTLRYIVFFKVCSIATHSIVRL